MQHEMPRWSKIIAFGGLQTFRFGGAKVSLRNYIPKAQPSKGANNMDRQNALSRSGIQQADHTGCAMFGE
jgi:hypothetical protein